MTHIAYILKTLRPQKKRLIISVAGMFGIMLVDLGSPLIIAVMIDTVVAQNRYDLLPYLMVFFLILPFAGAIFKFISDYTITILGQRVIFDIRLDLYRKMHKLHCQFMKNTPTGKLMERLRGDVVQLQTLLTTQAPQQVVQFATGIIMLLVMFVMSWQLTLVVIFGLSLYVVNYRIRIPKIRKIQRRFRRKMDTLSGLAQEKLTGAIVVKTFAHERHESRKFLHRNFAAERVFHRFRMLSLNYSIISSMITWTTYFVVVSYGALLAIRGQVTYGVVTAVTAFAFRLLTPAAMLAELSNQFQQGKIALDRIFELMNAEKDIIDKKGIKLANIKGQVRFNNVSFEYEPGKPVLQNINLLIQPGQTIALVGQTGCGKSTIINLLYRYYELQGGTIEVDGHDIATLDTRWYRRKLAMVPQEPIILDTTIAENIAYGQPNATRKQIESAARMVELGELIDELEDGLDTQLGEKGVKLSMGERQRLCIARAILSDPTILILDEATSSLDSQNEAMIQLAMNRVMTNRTCFIVAHRLSTIVNSDLIVVMDKGRILEMGNHAQLMKKTNGRYRYLYLTQTNTQRRVMQTA